MKTRKYILQLLSVLALALVATHAFAADVSDELEGLGSNQQVKNRAAQLDSRTRVGIVQGRAVDRNWRGELGVSYGPVAYGDSYVFTQNLGLNADLHINPRFSLGVHYAHAFNQLTSEGESRFNEARSNQLASVPQVTYPEESVMGVLDWYMTYGKINLFDWKVVQFDIYSLAGYGQIKVGTQLEGQTQEAWTDTWTAGLGIGFWFSKHITSRAEIRYQTYSDKVYTGSRDLNLIVANIGLGVLL